MNSGRHLLLTGDAVGGVWQYSLELAAALAPLGYQVTMAILGPAPDDAQRASAAAIPGLHLVETGLDLDWLAQDAASVQAAERHLAQLAADIHADIVQLHSPALASLGAFAIPVLSILHSCVASWWQAVRTGPLPDDFAWRTALVSDGLRRSTLVVTPSAAFGETVRALYGVRPITVHNGRTISVPAAPMMDHVFTAGRLWDEGKNLRTLDEAAQHIGVPFKAAGPLRAPHGEAIGLRHIHALGSLDGGALARQLASRPVFASAAPTVFEFGATEDSSAWVATNLGLQLLGQRHKDLKNGLSAPPKLTPKTLADLAMRWSWGIGMLSTNLSVPGDRIAVRISPGAMELTRTPKGPKSCAISRVSATNAALDVA